MGHLDAKNPNQGWKQYRNTCSRSGIEHIRVNENISFSDYLAKFYGESDDQPEAVGDGLDALSKDELLALMRGEVKPAPKKAGKVKRTLKRARKTAGESVAGLSVGSQFTSKYGVVWSVTKIQNGKVIAKRTTDGRESSWGGESWIEKKKKQGALRIVTA